MLRAMSGLLRAAAYGRAAAIAFALLLPATGAGVAPPAAAQADPGGEWTAAAALPETNSEIAVAELDGKLYVVGGYPSSRVVTNAVQVYDLAAGRWEMGPPLPAPLHHAVAAGVDGVLYVIGGEFEPSGVARAGVFQDAVWAYDPRGGASGAGAWQSRARMPTARSGMAGATLDGKIYVAGGRPRGGATSPSTTRRRTSGRRCRACRPSATTWRRSPSGAASTSRGGASAAASAAR